MIGPSIQTIEVESCTGCDQHRYAEIAPSMFAHRCLHAGARETFVGTPNGTFIAAGELIVRVPLWCPAKGES